MSKFTERLDILLHEYEMNRSQLSRRLGVAVSTVHRWFTRGSIPDGETVMHIAEIFNVSEKWLLGATDDRGNAKNEVIIKEDDLDDEIVRIIRSLNPQQIQRLKDFLAGLRG